jgi:3-keto-disaccharide hydrolase
MKKFLFCSMALMVLAACTGSKKITDSSNSTSESGWITLFDGTSLNNWKASENPATFTVDSGMIIVHGPRAHLFYTGPVQQANFKNFEFKTQVMTTPGSNSGIFIHTAYQETDWPAKGYEIQVNNSHTDWRRTGSLYAVDDVRDVYVKDGEWYTEYIKVQGKHITVKINDRTVVDYNEPDSVAQNITLGGKRLSSGTFALQGHDPNSKVYFKDVFVRPLAD